MYSCNDWTEFTLEDLDYSQALRAPVVVREDADLAAGLRRKMVWCPTREQTLPELQDTPEVSLIKSERKSILVLK